MIIDWFVDLKLSTNQESVPCQNCLITNTKVEVAKKKKEEVMFIYSTQRSPRQSFDLSLHKEFPTRDKKVLKETKQNFFLSQEQPKAVSSQCIPQELNPLCTFFVLGH